MERHAVSLTPRVIVTFVASILGLGVSIYLTLAHYTNAVSLTCPLGGTGHFIDCGKVTSSAESVVFGIPVAVLGLAFFVPMIVLLSPWAWASAHRYVAPVRLGMSIVSIGFISYLLYSELYTIHSICIWCTAVHILSFIIFVGVITGWDEAIAPRTGAKHS